MGRMNQPKESPIQITEHTIEAMAQHGMTQRQIADALMVDHRILRKYYPMTGLFQGGHPKKEVDYATLERIAGVGCTDSEIAVAMGIEVSTHLKKVQADEQYREAIKSGREKVKKELRELRWNLAKGIKDIDGKWIEKPNTAMIFRLSRELLGERDFNGATAIEKKEEITYKFDFKNMTIEELKEVKATISKLKERDKQKVIEASIVEVHNT